MERPWFCRQCGRLVNGIERRAHLWAAHLLAVLDEDKVIVRFFAPVWN